MTITELYQTKHEYIRKTTAWWFRFKPELIDDMTQDFYIVMQRKLPTFKEGQLSIDNWIRMHLLYFLRAKYYRHKIPSDKYYNSFEDIDTTVILDQTKSDQIEEFHKHLRIQKLRSKLTDKQKQIIDVLLQDHDVKDLPKILGTSKQNLYMRFKTIKQNLRRYNV